MVFTPQFSWICCGKFQHVKWNKSAWVSLELKNGFKISSKHKNRFIFLKAVNFTRVTIILHVKVF